VVNLARIFDFRHKEVINISDGKRLGFIEDVDLNTENGEISSVIIPVSGKILGVFGKDTEYVIPWDSIKKIGQDIVLVDFVENT